MIKSITFKKDFRCFVKGDKFDFRSGINVLVGDQGSGKSTLIELIRSKLESNKFDSSDSSYRAKSIVLFNKIDDFHTHTLILKTRDRDRDRDRDRPIPIYAWYKKKTTK